ncbi:DNA cytosine methyltransferase [Microvirga makkahensis]|uniref:DNA (cytosine-5-)-methyltransferase n=1 Tax=Microvirga makkahensis TaxID=1128670 RepID=A0A7X3MNQ3_9HYPH|nr:DNA cytosine methyltransferase [Microvirga makkahensis]
MRVIELFCGAGGMGLGLTQAGFKIQKAYDNWQPALDVHRANLSPWLAPLTGDSHVRVSDLGDLTRAAPDIADLKPEMIAGGPPCVEFSRAKRNRKEGKLADLTAAFAVIIGVTRPRYFVMENVVDAQKSDAYSRARSIFKFAGYGLTESVLKASFYQVGQARTRLIVVGCMGEVDGFLDEHLNDLKSPRPMTVGDVLGADFGVDFGDGRGKLYWSGPGGKSSPGTRRVDWPSPTILRSTPWAPGKNYLPRRGDVDDVWRLPVPTRTQFARLQGFPETWDWDPCGGKTKFARMLANSVPPPLARAVGQCVMAHSRGERPAIKREIPFHFEEWLQEQGFPTQRIYDTKAAYRTVQQYLGPATQAPLETAIALLDRIPAVASASPQRKSNLKKALRLYDECVFDLIKRGLPPFETQHYDIPEDNGDPPDEDGWVTISPKKKRRSAQSN